MKSGVRLSPKKFILLFKPFFPPLLPLMGSGGLFVPGVLLLIDFLSIANLLGFSTFDKISEIFGRAAGRRRITCSRVDVHPFHAFRRH